jgi:uncharacterized protein DUF4349
MTAFRHDPGSRPVPAARATRRWQAANLAGVLLAGGACLLAVGCSGTAGNSSSAGIAAPAEPGSAAGGSGAAGGNSAAGGHGVAKVPAGAPGVKRRLTTLPAPGRQSIVYTASLTVRSAHVAAAAAQAAQLAKAAGGYVSSEHTTTSSPRHPAGGSVYLQLKVPAAAYPATLAAVARLGTRLSQSQQARDVTQTVADVSSRVTSAQQAIAQLRKLLSRAGTVQDLLAVQEQINGEEASLEALQAQQRALAHETTFATISLDLRSPPAVAVRQHPRTAGFTGGLAAGWRALRTVAAGLLTAAGAMLPFLIPAALLVAAGYRARRWHLKRHAGTSQAE